MSSSRLQSLDLIDFTGGFVASRSQFTLADNESPSMLNIEVDPRGGIYTRKGWLRWNDADPTAPENWNPRSASLHPISNGSIQLYVASRETPTQGTVWAAGGSTTFVDLNVPCNAAPHLVDFAPWGDTMYMATGQDAAAVGGAPHKQTAVGLPVLMTLSPLADASLAYNDDYTDPHYGRFPFAEFCETHAGYVFCAAVREGGTSTEWNRVRWSHPDNPEDWAADDFIDIQRGGGRITGLLSFRDHLLIFKTDSIWALYGYDMDSWQLVQVSMAIGVPAPTAFTRSETAVYFYSAADSNAIYAYDGGQPVLLSDKVRTVVEQVVDHDDVFLGWTAQRLWCSLPVMFSRYPGVPGTTATTREMQASLIPNTVLVFDPAVGEGLWVRHAPGAGKLGPFVERSDISVAPPLVALTGDSGAACVLALEALEDPVDMIWTEYGTLLIDGTDGDIITDGTSSLHIVDGPYVEGHTFFTFYRTGWKHAGWIERRKSWLRPRYVARVPRSVVRIRADVYRDYDESTVHRSASREIRPAGGHLWGPASDPLGTDWGAGDTWGAGQAGGLLTRAVRSLGVARAVQLEIMGDPITAGQAWGIDAVHLPYNFRRFTT